MKAFVRFLISVALLHLSWSQDSSDSGEESVVNCPFDQRMCILENGGIKTLDCNAYLLGMFYCNARYCPGENFDHDYIGRGQKRVAHTNRWKNASIGEWATLRDLCLLPNGLPVTRKCQVGQMRAQWEPMANQTRVACLRETREKTLSADLNRLHVDIIEGQRKIDYSDGRHGVTTTMRNILRHQSRQILPFDMEIINQVFGELMSKADKDSALAADMLSSYSELMASKSTVLRLAARQNSTNSLLYKFETYLDGLPEQLVPRESCGKAAVIGASSSSEPDSGVQIINNVTFGVHALMAGNLSVFFVNPVCDNITGIAIYSSAAPHRLSAGSGFWYRYLHGNESVATLKAEPALETAALLTDQLWQSVRDRGAKYLIFKVYAHDALFVETATLRTRRPRSKVISISITNFTAKLPHPLPFLLRNENQRRPDALATSLGSGCGFWNYETWQSDGITTILGPDMLRDPIIVCQTFHLTQFSFLVGGSYRINDLGEEVLVTPLNEQILDIISLVGCCLSLFGLLGIWLTAAVFSSWRSKDSTKILLNLCLALTLQNVLFVFLNTDNMSEQLILACAYVRCILLGALMQYSILVIFSWMLIIALLQFQRYVTVIGIQRPRNYIIKAAIVAWTLPLLPTVLVAAIDPDSYLPTESQLATDTGICYPSGHGLIFGVVLPITLIIIANLIIFVSVFYSISNSLGQTMQRTERKLVAKQIQLSVLLFFLLGLSWIFGIFAFMHAGIVFSYLFCLTATLQGFVLFVYFVLLDQVNRRAWLGLIWPTKMKMDVEKPSRELQSLNTTSTNYSTRSQH